MCGERIHLIGSISLSSPPVAGVWWAHTLDWLYDSLSPPVAGVWWAHTLDWLYDSLSEPVAGVWWAHTLDWLYDSLSPPVAGVWWAHTLDWLYDSLSPPVAGVWWAHTLDWLYDSLSPPVAGVWWAHTLDWLYDSLSPPVAGVWWAYTQVGIQYLHWHGFLSNILLGYSSIKDLSMALNTAIKKNPNLHKYTLALFSKNMFSFCMISHIYIFLPVCQMLASVYYQLWNETNYRALHCRPFLCTFIKPPCSGYSLHSQRMTKLTVRCWKRSRSLPLVNYVWIKCSLQLLTQKLSNSFFFSRDLFSFASVEIYRLILSYMLYLSDFIFFIFLYTNRKNHQMLFST